MAINVTTNVGDEQKVETFDKHNTEAVQPKEEVNNTKPTKAVETTPNPAVEADDKDEDLDYLSKDPEDTETEDDDLDDEEDEDDEVEEDQKPKKSGFKRRVDKLTKKISELETKLAQREAQDGNKPNKEEKPTTAFKSDDENLIEPKLDDFDVFGDYLKALTKYELALFKQENKQKTYNEQVEQETQRINKAWQDKVADASKRYKDWGNVQKADNIPLTTFMRTAIMESDLGADIVYYLYKNPDKASEIAKLSSISQGKAIGRIEAKLEDKVPRANKPAEGKATTKAPDPVKPISKSNTTGSSKKAVEDMDFKEFKAYRISQLKKK